MEERLEVGQGGKFRGGLRGLSLRLAREFSSWRISTVNYVFTLFHQFNKFIMDVASPSFKPRQCDSCAFSSTRLPIIRFFLGQSLRTKALLAGMAYLETSYSADLQGAIDLACSSWQEDMETGAVTL
jgi:hypothetical protein